MIPLAAALWGILGNLAQEEGQRPLPEAVPNTAHLPRVPFPERLTVRAESLAAAGDFEGALALYEEVLRERPAGVVPLDETIAVGAWEFIQRRIATWPEKGLEIYRRQVDPEVRRRFESARAAADAEGLERLAGEFPHSTLSSEALVLAAALHLDRGAGDRAAGILSRLLASPGTPPRPEILGRLGLALAREGRKKDLEELARKTERELPGAAIWIGPARRDLASFLRELASTTREAPPVTPVASNWKMMGGHPCGSRLVPPGVLPAPLMWSTFLRPFQYASDHPAGGWPSQLFSGNPPAEHRPYFPAISDGILYVHNETTLSAFQLFASRPEVLWKHEVPEPAGEVLFDDRVIFATTVHAGRVYANLITSVDRPEEPPIPIRVQYPFPRRALLALDAFGGKLLWKLGGQIRRDALEENATFATPPTPDGDRLYVGAVKQKLPLDPFEHYILCLEAATGRILWSTLVASGGTEINLFGNPIRESLGSPVSVAGDTLYYCTHHGVFAALDKHDGKIRWVHRYRQIPVRAVRTPFAPKSALGWINSPPLAGEEVVVGAPMDAPAVYGFDARTGALRWAHPRSPWIRTLVGLRGTTLVLGGEGLEFLDVRSGKLRAVIPAELHGTGRGVVAEDGILVPTARGLARVGWDGSREILPTGEVHRPMIGNLIVTDGALGLGTPTGVEVYGTRASPGPRALTSGGDSDPTVRYHAALRMIQSGQAREGEEILGRLVREAPSSEDPLAQAARKRLYALKMEEGRKALGDGKFHEATAAFEKALEWASDPSSQRETAFLQARALAAGGDPREALRRLHRLLAEEGEEMVAGEKVSSRARGEIDRVLKQWGREVYGFLEAEASRLLAEARRRRSTEAFLEVPRLFPNSRAAEEAFLEAAALQGRLGRTEEEIGTLGRFLREYPDSPRVPLACARLVRALERRGRREAAAALLRRMEREFPTAEVEEEAGNRTTAGDFARRRLAREEYRLPEPEVPRPALFPPLRKIFEWRDPEGRQGTALAALGQPPPAVADFLFLNYGTLIRAFDLSRGVLVWTLRTPFVVEFAAFPGDSLLVAGDRGAFRLDPRDGRLEWRHEFSSPARGFLLTGEHLCFTGTDPRTGGTIVSALDLDRGAPAWTASFPGTRRVSTDGSILRKAGDAVCFLTIEPCRIHLIERETGRRIGAGIPFPSDLTAQLEYASETLALVSSRGRFLEAYGLPSGPLRWRSGLSGLSVRELKVARDRVVILGAMGLPGRAPPETALWTLGLESGKILKMVSRVDLGDPRHLELDGGIAYLVSRDPDRSSVVRGIRLEDLSILWKTRLEPPDAETFSLVLAEGHLVVPYFQTAPDGTFRGGGALLDRSGNLVQNIQVSSPGRRPPHGSVTGGRMVFCLDDRVEVHR